jgi:anti-sigma regulatory factor (Ser/Thr protein kinase)
MRVAVTRFASTVATVPSVRAATVRTLTEWGAAPEAVDVAETVIGELAANAVEASSPVDFVAVRLSATNGHILIEVWDRNDDTKPRLTYSGADAERGHGLVIVEALSSRWSWYAAKSGGKVVWAQCPGRLLPATGNDTTPMPTRTARNVPPPARPVAYQNDPETLQRVANALRALDTWHQPPGQPTPLATATRS